MIHQTGELSRFPHILPKFDGRIVGGYEVEIEDFPYQLALLHVGKPLCGASIVSSKTAITAAHCTHDRIQTNYSVRAGSSFIESGGIVIDVNEVHEHPKFDRYLLDYDVSVLKLAEPLVFSPFIQPVKLDEKGRELEPGHMCTVSGWGTLSWGGSFPTKKLQAVDVPKVLDMVCRNAYGHKKVTNRMICHGYGDGGKDACQGDSGGPLVCDGVQIGIVSFGNRCAVKGYPGVYSKISEESIHDHITKFLD
ncbi:hypothetical protein ILUMI_20740 [Ignelater luminosus]|uniref:Peptidase S1 domain-containing protein n=1 Tax=Ignelater luminosus TaxID=2038154 RepID=A0A8K0CKB5_IGNLU|nr:hypothetical protein ILUMI_20740 [Ignelater luminosus]